MPNYRLTDDNYSEIIEADDLEEACRLARDSWESGSWDTKCIVDIRVTELDDEGDETNNYSLVSVECGDDPEPPECTEDDRDWCSPLSVLGGCDSNPGVWSLGGTTIQTMEVCRHCGIYRKNVIHGSQRNPGECDTVEYLPADEDSINWVESL